MRLLVPPVSASRSTSRVVKNSDVEGSLVIVVASLGNGLGNSTSLVHGVSRFMVVFGHRGLPSVCGEGIGDSLVNCWAIGGLGNCDDLGGRVLVVVLCDCHSLGFGRAVAGLRDSDSLGGWDLVVGLRDRHSFGRHSTIVRLSGSNSLGDGILVVGLRDCHSLGLGRAVARLRDSDSLGGWDLVVGLRDCHSLSLSKTVARLRDSDSLDGWDLVAGLSVGDCSCNGDCFTIKAISVVSRDSKGDWNGSKKESWCRELHNAEMLRSVLKMIGILNECWIVVHSRACTPDDLYRCHYLLISHTSIVNLKDGG